jgi:hypothetical protein
MGKYINKNSNGTGLGSSASDKINRFRRRNNYQHSCWVEWKSSVVDNGFSAAGAYDEKKWINFITW